MLTPEQMEEAVEAMARAYSGAPFPSHRSRDKARAALTAALPVIERAVLGRAMEVAEDHGADIVSDAIRALAGEER